MPEKVATLTTSASDSTSRLTIMIWSVNNWRN